MKNKKQKEYLVIYAFDTFDGSKGFGNVVVTFNKKTKITEKEIRDIETKTKGEIKHIKNCVIINIIKLDIEK